MIPNSLKVIASTRTRDWRSTLKTAARSPAGVCLESGIPSPIAFFGTDENVDRIARLAVDQSGYFFPDAPSSRYPSCDPKPIKVSDLEFEARIQLELKRDRSGGGCG